jgi:ABC-type Fe3+-hydroxamate transport system substrate-binding protein
VRIVSLVPSSTETLVALGADVVACTRFCEQPDITHVGGTKNPDIEAIVNLGPDVVVMDREENRREDADALVERGVVLHVSDVRTVHDALNVVDDLAGLAGVAAPASSPEPVAVPTWLTAFVPIWRRPWMTVNGETYGGSVLAHIGVRLITHGWPSSYPEITLDRMAALRPDVILVPSEPYDFHDAHIDELAAAFGSDVPIVRVDGQDLFWWGIRTPAAMIRLTDAIGRSGAGHA